MASIIPITPGRGVATATIIPFPHRHPEIRVEARLSPSLRDLALASPYLSADDRTRVLRILDRGRV